MYDMLIKELKLAKVSKDFPDWCLKSTELSKYWLFVAHLVSMIEKMKKRRKIADLHHFL